MSLGKIREKFDLKPGQKVDFIPYKNSLRLVIVPDVKAAYGFCRRVAITAELDLHAAQLSIDHKLPMADSLILASARLNDAELWTQDSHFTGLEGVTIVGD